MLMGSHRFKPLEACSSEGRADQTVASDLDGTLLIYISKCLPLLHARRHRGRQPSEGRDCFSSPPFPSCASFTYSSPSLDLAIRMLVYISFAGLKMRDVEVVARSVLPRFYAEDVYPESWRVFASFGKKYIVTASPRVMVEPFAKSFLGADRQGLWGMAKLLYGNQRYHSH